MAGKQRVLSILYRLSILSRMQLYCSVSLLLLLSCLEDCCVVASCLFCAVRSLGTCSSVNFVQVQSVIIFDNESAAWSCVLHMNGGGCFLKSFSLRTVKLSSRWLEIVVCYIWLEIGGCF